MSTVIRLRQLGRRNRRVYRCVVTEKRSRRDGKYLECVGHYDPHKEDGVVMKEDRVQYWLERGSQPTEKVKHLLKQTCPGVLKAPKPSA